MGEEDSDDMSNHSKEQKVNQKEELIKPKLINVQSFMMKKTTPQVQLSERIPELQANYVPNKVTTKYIISSCAQAIKLTDSQIETKESIDHTYIDSIYPGGDKIKVTRMHLNRILKRRQLRRKVSIDDQSYPTCRPRTEGPIHGSRSRFAKKRPRDQNGRFYTKEELEEMRLQQHKDSVLEFLRSHCIGTIDADDFKNKTPQQIYIDFPEKVFNIQRLTRNA